MALFNFGDFRFNKFENTILVSKLVLEGVYLVHVVLLVLFELVELVFSFLQSQLEVVCPRLLPVGFVDFLCQFVVVVLTVLCLALVSLLHFFGLLLHLLLQLLNLLHLVLQHSVLRLDQLRQVVALGF